MPEIVTNAERDEALSALEAACAIPDAAIQAATAAWHDGPEDGVPLHTHLGMTWPQYQRWATDGTPPAGSPEEQHASTDTAQTTACCDLGKTDDTGDENGIVAGFCRHRLTGDYSRYWDDSEDEDDAVSDDPAYPLIHVTRIPDDPSTPYHECLDPACPATLLCKTHYDVA